MARNRTVSPSSTGKRPAMKKMYDGRNTATRPIPVSHDSSDERAIRAAAADSKPKTSAVNMPSGPRPTNSEAVFGRPVAGSQGVKGGVFNPLTGTGNFE